MSRREKTFLWGLKIFFNFLKFSFSLNEKKCVDFNEHFHSIFLFEKKFFSSLFFLVVTVWNLFNRNEVGKMLIILISINVKLLDGKFFFLFINVFNVEIKINQGEF